MAAIEAEKIAFREAHEALTKAINSDLVGCAILLQRLLGAVDLFPDGGLHEGHYAEQAIRRYWLLWMPLLHKQQQEQQQEKPLASPSSAHLIIPPLDIQWAWYVHRLNPIKYLADCTAAFGAPVHPIDGPQALGFVAASAPQHTQHHHQNQQGRQQEKGTQEGEAVWLQWEDRGELTRQVWEEAYPSGPGQPPEHQLWPPAPPPSPHLPITQLLQTYTAFIQTQPPFEGEGSQAAALATLCVKSAEGQMQTGDGADTDTATDDLAAMMVPVAGRLESVRGYVLDAIRRQSIFLHQTLRSPYTNRTFLEAARQRYLRFLALAATRRPTDPWLVPMYEIDLMWHTHLALSGAYSVDCGELLPTKPSPLMTTMTGVEGPDAGVGPSERMLGHDDGLTGGALLKGCEVTIQRYEALTGLVYNVSPTRRLATEQAHPLVSQLWPLVAVLAAVSTAQTQATDGSATTTAKKTSTPGEGAAATSGPPPPPGFQQALSLPPPRRIASELADTMVTPLPQRRSHQHPWGKPSFTSHLKLRLPRLSKTNAQRGKGNGGSRVLQGFLGSPDHLSRSGVFALYGLWCLGRGLEGAETMAEAATAATGTAATAAQNSQPYGGGGGGGGSVDSGRGSGGSGFVGRAASALFRGVAKLRCGSGAAGAGGAAWEATVDAAISYMTQEMLLLADPTHPTSPLLSSLHPFWSDLMPMVPPSQLTTPHISPPPDPLPSPPSSPSPPPPAPPPPAPPSQSGPDRPRLPAPPPPLDLPAEYFPMSSRNGHGVYLAPTHYSAAAWVAYTPSDFCVLGRGRWCLPPDLAEEIVEEEAREATVSDLYEDGINPHSNTSTKHCDTHCRHNETGKKSVHGCGAAALSSAASSSAVGAGRGGLRFRPFGPGSHPDNVLGEVVFSKGWRRRLARCYGVIYKEMMNRGRVAGQDVLIREWF